MKCSQKVRNWPAYVCDFRHRCLTAVGKGKQIYILLGCSMELNKRDIPAVTIESLSFHITKTHKLNNLNSFTITGIYY